MNLGSSLFELEIQRNQNKNGVFILIRGFRAKKRRSVHTLAPMTYTGSACRRVCKMGNGGESIMIEKNMQKLKNKKRRNFWTCSRPVTQITPNKKDYNRKRFKDTMNKGRAAYEMLSSCGYAERLY